MPSNANVKLKGQPSGNIIPLHSDKDVEIKCMDNLRFMHNLEPGSMKLIVTSPPYNIGKAYETRRSLEKYKEAQAATIAEAVRVLHPKGSICWQVGNYVDDGEVTPLDIMLFPLFANHHRHLHYPLLRQLGQDSRCLRRFSGLHE